MNPSLHPDPDSLNAFIEGVLPEHERAECLAHLAECSQCREVVFLAQEIPAASAASPVRSWKRWFAPLPALASAAAVSIAAIAVWVYYSQHHPGVPASDIVARTSPAPPNPPPSSGQGTPLISQAQKLAERRRIRPSMPTRPSVTPEPPIPGEVERAPEPVAATLPPTTPEVRTVAGVSGILGTVTDASGAAIPGATIKARPRDGSKTVDARTDVAGQFSLAGLPPGRYELDIVAQGFRQTSRQIDVQSGEMASVKSQLEVGSVAETVEVTAAAPMMQTSSASMSRVRKKAEPEGPNPVPSKLPTATTVANGKVMLAVDSAGALFVSRNSGKSWKAVKPGWQGKVRTVAVAAPAQTSIAAFQLTTDSDATWLSRDGAHWFPALAKR